MSKKKKNRKTHPKKRPTYRAQAQTIRRAYRVSEEFARRILAANAAVRRIMEIKP